MACPGDYYMVAFRIQSQSAQGSGDDTALNNVSFLCRGPGLDGGDTVTITGPGGNQGTWGDWSDQCQGGSVICSVQTRVEPKNDADCAGTSNLKFNCCVL